MWAASPAVHERGSTAREKGPSRATLTYSVTSVFVMWMWVVNTARLLLGTMTARKIVMDFDQEFKDLLSS